MMRSFVLVLPLFRTVSIASASFFFFNDTATTEIYTLSLHDALPISSWVCRARALPWGVLCTTTMRPVDGANRDRKSTRLNSSHSQISYAVFCLKKKKITYTKLRTTRHHVHMATYEMAAESHESRGTA